MRYIYKHGNQYWYQRAIPEKLAVLLGKKTLKVSLKTNKVNMAIKRAKLQALEHQKMFVDLKNNSKKNFKSFFGSKLFDLNKYTLSFIEDFDDLINKDFFKSAELKKISNNQKIDKSNYSSIEKTFQFQSKPNILPKLSDVLLEYKHQKKISSNSKKLYSIRKSVSIMIDICDDKPIDLYDLDDAKKFQNHFLKLNKISTGKRNQSNVQNIFSVMFDKYSVNKKNPFSGLRWPYYKQTISKEPFTLNELHKIKTFCLEEHSIISLVCGLIFDTGCSFREIIGLTNDDISLSKYNPYLVIRSNYYREVNNIYKRRIIPLVGLSLETMGKVQKASGKELLFKSYIDERKKYDYLANKINSKLDYFSKGKTFISFKYSIINRLKLINCPESVICEVVGLAKKQLFYDEEVSLDTKSSWLSQIII